MLSLFTLRLELRCPSAPDVAELKGLWLDEEVRRYLGGTVAPEQAGARLAATVQAWAERGYGMATVAVRESGALAGLCGLHPSDHGGLEVSYMLYPSFWGQGYAREAVFCWLEYARDVLRAPNVIAVTQEANTRSTRLLEACGMNWQRSFQEFGAMQRLYSTLG